MMTDPAELVEQSDSFADRAERVLEGRRHEADSIRDALRDAREGLRRARVGLAALAAIERDEAREPEA